MKVYTNSGTLSFYGFACGYQDVKQNGDNSKRIYKEHNIYFVSATINNEGIREAFETLSEARKYFNDIAI